MSPYLLFALMLATVGNASLVPGPRAEGRDTWAYAQGGRLVCGGWGEALAPAGAVLWRAGQRAWGRAYARYGAEGQGAWPWAT